MTKEIPSWKLKLCAALGQASSIEELPIDKVDPNWGHAGFILPVQNWNLVVTYIYKVDELRIQRAYRIEDGFIKYASISTNSLIADFVNGNVEYVLMQALADSTRIAVWIDTIIDTLNQWYDEISKTSIYDELMESTDGIKDPVICLCRELEVFPLEETLASEAAKVDFILRMLYYKWSDDDTYDLV